MARYLAASVLALTLVACSGDGDGDATPTPTATSSVAPSPTGDSTSGGPVCEYLRDVVVTAVANAQARVDLNEIFDQLGQAQLQLQEFGVDLVDRKRTEPFGRAVLEVNASVAKVRIGITTGDPEQISAYANEVRNDLTAEAIVERCGEIPLGEA